VVPHRSTNRARTCLTSLSRREAVLSSWYGRSYNMVTSWCINTCLLFFNSTLKLFNNNNNIMMADGSAHDLHSSFSLA
jgi:hypothetical protein